jgi:hypothetical protein
MRESIRKAVEHALSGTAAVVRNAANATLIFPLLLLLLVVLEPRAQASPTRLNWQSSNLLVNPGFESGSLTGWTLGVDYCGAFGDSPCSSWAVANDDAHNGTYSVKDVGGTELVQYFAPVPGALIVDLSFWFKQDPALAFAYELMYSDGTTSMMVIFPEETDWQFYDVTSSVDPARALAGIGFANYSSTEGNGPAWLDEVKVEYLRSVRPTPEPSCALILSVGLLWLGGLRYRQFR